MSEVFKILQGEIGGYSLCSPFIPYPLRIVYPKDIVVCAPVGRLSAFAYLKDAERWAESEYLEIWLCDGEDPISIPRILTYPVLSKPNRQAALDHFWNNPGYEGPEYDQGPLPGAVWCKSIPLIRRLK